MSYIDDASELGRQALTIVRFQFDVTISPGGDEWVCSGEAPDGERMYPCLESVKYAPTRTGTYGGLGYVGSVIATFRDFRYPFGNGFWFRRLLANNPYYLNRKMNVYSGYYKKGESFSTGNMNIGEFFIKRIEGPDANGVVKVQADDVTSRLRDTELPTATDGALNAALNSSATGTLNITDNTGFTSGYVIINDELIAYSGTSGGDSIVTTARAQGGSTAASHAANDPVRHVEYLTGNVVDVIRDLVEDFSEIDHSTYLPDTDWNTERDTYLSGDDVDVWVIEQITLDRLIDELAKQAMITLWYDGVDKEIKLKAIGPTLSQVASWDDDNHILDDRIRIKRDQREILTSVWSFYNTRNHTQSVEPKNFAGVHIEVDSIAENGLGETKNRTLFGNFVKNLATASKVANRIISQNANPIELDIYVDAKDSEVQIGELIDIDSDLIQDENGDNQLTRMRVIEREELKNSKYRYKLIFSGVEIGSRYAVVGPNSLVDYLLASTAEQNAYGWICNNSNTMSNSDDPYLIL